MSLLDKWSEVKTIIDNLEFDLVKNAKGNVCAGIRLRKALRMLRNLSIEMLAESKENDHALREHRLATRTQLTPEQKARRYSALRRKREAQIKACADKASKKK